MPRLRQSFLKILLRSAFRRLASVRLQDSKRNVNHKPMICLHENLPLKQLNMPKNKRNNNMKMNNKTNSFKMNSFCKNNKNCLRNKSSKCFSISKFKINNNKFKINNNLFNNRFNNNNNSFSNSTSKFKVSISKFNNNFKTSSNCRINLLPALLRSSLRTTALV